MTSITASPSLRALSAAGGGNCRRKADICNAFGPSQVCPIIAVAPFEFPNDPIRIDNPGDRIVSRVAVSEFEHHALKLLIVAPGAHEIKSAGVSIMLVRIGASQGVGMIMNEANRSHTGGRVRKFRAIPYTLRIDHIIF